MTDTLTDYDQKPAGRPTFLTVLCILTFIGSGWGLISNALGYFSANEQAAAISVAMKKANTDIQQTGKSDEGTKFAERIVTSTASAFTPENLRKTAIAGIVTAIFCLLGAILMWQIKKTGFYSYLLGTLIGISAPFIIYGGTNMMAILKSILIGFVGLIFVILYGVNLKHMK